MNEGVFLFKISTSALNFWIRKTVKFIQWLNTLLWIFRCAKRDGRTWEIQKKKKLEILWTKRYKIQIPGEIPIFGDFLPWTKSIPHEKTQSPISARCLRPANGGREGRCVLRRANPQRRRRCEVQTRPRLFLFFFFKTPSSTFLLLIFLFPLQLRPRFQPQLGCQVRERGSAPQHPNQTQQIQTHPFRYPQPRHRSRSRAQTSSSSIKQRGWLSGQRRIFQEEEKGERWSHIEFQTASILQQWWR